MALEVLWQRVDVGGETCERCGDTGAGVRRAVERLREKLASRGIEVTLAEKILPPWAVAESNRVFFNGLSVEELLGAAVGMNHCRSCCELLGAPTDCRTLCLDGREYEALPEELMVRAGLLAVEKFEAGAR